MYCNNCGGFVQDGAANCPNCGMMMGAPDAQSMGYGQAMGQPMGQQMGQPMGQPSMGQMGYSQPVGQPMGYGGRQPAHGMAVASLVLGILPFAICWIGEGVGYILGMIMAIVGIVLGAVARKQGNRGGIAIAGLVVSIVALAILGVLFIIALIYVANNPWLTYKYY